MSIKNIVTSKEVSERLKEVGVEQISRFYYINSYFATDINSGFKIITLEELKSSGRRLIDYEHYSAYLISELLEKLSNAEIMMYCGKHREFASTGAMLDLVRNPDALAEVVLWKLENKKVKCSMVAVCSTQNCPHSVLHIKCSDCEDKCETINDCAECK